MSLEIIYAVCDNKRREEKLDMRKVVLYIAISIDGFIATEDGTIDWLSSIVNPDNEDHGYAQFLDEIDVTLIGRKTYEQILSFPTPFPYPTKSNYVFSRHKPKHSDEFAHWIDENLESFVRRLKEENGKAIWLIGGQQLNESLLRVQLIDRMIISILPIVLGRGIPLFGSQVTAQQFQHLETKSFPSTGCVQITYDKKT
jgi:dihydrofolate reductase